MFHKNPCYHGSWDWGTCSITKAEYHGQLVNRQARNRTGGCYNKYGSTSKAPYRPLANETHSRDQHTFSPTRWSLEGRALPRVGIPPEEATTKPGQHHEPWRLHSLSLGSSVQRPGRHHASHGPRVSRRQGPNRSESVSHLLLEDVPSGFDPLRVVLAAALRNSTSTKVRPPIRETSHALTAR